MSTQNDGRRRAFNETLVQFSIASLPPSQCLWLHDISWPKTDISYGRKPRVPNTVTSLQPVLEWVPSEKKEATYEVIVVEQFNDPQHHKVFNPGRTVFIREGITETKVRIEPPLEFDRIYWWSVRARNGDGVSEWSRYDYSGSYFYVHVYAKNFPYPFRTPVNENGLSEDAASP